MPARGTNDTNGANATNGTALDRTKLAAARLLASEAQPYLAMALYALTPIPDTSRPTFAVDEHWRLYVNPQALARWPVAQVAGVLLHEVGHVIRDHAARARAIGVTNEDQARRWNAAADAEINDDLLAAGIELPPTPVTPQALALPPGKVAEFYYAALEAHQVPPDMPNCGPGCHAQEQPVTTQTLPPGLSQTAALLLRKRVAEQITQLAQRHPGTLPGGWLRWAQALLKPRLDWRKLLTAKVRSSTAAVAGAVDYSYARPARRRVDHVVLPALRRPLPRVAIIIDTSGSVDDDTLQIAWTEVHGCLRQLGIRRDMLTVYAADTEARKLRGLPRQQQELPGGGGTDMAQAITTVIHTRPAPDLVVVITDGHTPWPASRPRQDVIVALLATPLPPPPAPPWAKAVEISQRPPAR